MTHFRNNFETRRKCSYNLVQAYIYMLRKGRKRKNVLNVVRCEERREGVIKLFDA